MSKEIPAHESNKLDEHNGDSKRKVAYWIIYGSRRIWDC